MENSDIDEVNATRDALLDHARRYADLGMAPDAEALAAGAPFGDSSTDAPLILDTDIGGDADDAVAVAVAARVPQLALVITTDETDTRRARFARHLLNLCGRADVPVVAGRDLGQAAHFCVDDLIPADAHVDTSDVSSVVRRVLDTGGVARWVGMGPMSNLADLAATAPDLVDRLTVTQMGGALNYRHPDRAEHNVRIDVEAACRVLELVNEPTLITSDVTFTPEIEITTGSELYRMLDRHGAWGQLLRAHMDRWFDRFHSGTMQHDALTLAHALGLPFTTTGLETVALDDLGRMRQADDGSRVFLAYSTDYQAFNRWLATMLTTSLQQAG